MYFVVGDVHGEFEHMERLIDEMIERAGVVPDRIIQVGDFGFYPGAVVLPTKDWGCDQWFIRGNHENHPELLRRAGGAAEPVDVGCGPWKYVPDGYISEQGELFIGGAYSVDKRLRIMAKKQNPNFPFGWHKEEEIQDWSAIDNLDLDGVHTIFTHDCPYKMLMIMHAQPIKNKTSMGLQRLMSRLEEPASWYFGHHHRSFQHVETNVSFHCIDQIPYNYSIEVIENDLRTHDEQGPSHRHHEEE